MNNSKYHSSGYAAMSLVRGNLLTTVMLLLLACLYSPGAHAGAGSRAIRRMATYLLEKAGLKASKKAVSAMALRLERLGARYGKSALRAVQKTGPRGLKAIEEAGRNAPMAIRAINSFGKAGLYVASKPGRLALFVRYGDDAARAMIAHPGTASMVIRRFGKPAAKALMPLSSRNARRLAMLSADDFIAANRSSRQLLPVIGKYGDRAMNFIWTHKGSLAVSAAMVAFIRDPEPFINGTRDIATVTVRAAAKTPEKVVVGVAQNTNWTMVILAILAGGACWLLIKRRFLASHRGFVNTVTMPAEPADRLPEAGDDHEPKKSLAKISDSVQNQQEQEQEKEQEQEQKQEENAADEPGDTGQ